MCPASGAPVEVCVVACRRGTKNDAIQTSSRTMARTVNAVGNLNFFAGTSAGSGASWLKRPPDLPNDRRNYLHFNAFDEVSHIPRKGFGIQGASARRGIGMQACLWHASLLARLEMTGSGVESCFRSMMDAGLGGADFLGAAVGNLWATQDPKAAAESSSTASHPGFRFNKRKRRSAANGRNRLGVLVMKGSPVRIRASASSLG